MSTYLWALDERIRMAAPGCYITSFFHNFDNELPVDAEQAIPGLAAAGFEMADFLIARAPEPCLILGRGNDFFDPRGGGRRSHSAGTSTICSAPGTASGFSSRRANTVTAPATGGRCTVSSPL